MFRGVAQSALPDRDVPVDLLSHFTVTLTLLSSYSISTGICNVTVTATATVLLLFIAQSGITLVYNIIETQLTKICSHTL